MVTIHVLQNDGWVIPCVYMRLPGELTTLYKAALEALDSLPQVDLDPQTVLADYELAIRNSVLTIWPCTVVCGCLFHWKQAMLRNAASMGLAPFYKIIGSPAAAAWSVWPIWLRQSGGVSSIYGVHNIYPSDTPPYVDEWFLLSFYHFCYFKVCVKYCLLLMYINLFLNLNKI